MTQGPDRIWALHARSSTVYASGNTPVIAQDGPFTHYGYGEAGQYLALEGETLRAVRAAMWEAADTIDMAYGGPDDDDPYRYSAHLRAAIAKLGPARAQGKEG